YCGLISTQRTLHNGFKEEGIKEGIKKGMEKGIEKGKKEGRKEGIEKGRKEGMEKGKKEGKREGRKEGIEESLTNIVITCHRKNYSVEQIQEITGLSAERILKIINPPLLNDENQSY
ncbi:MAG: hypothetical protein LBU34_16705, partial [Planctomycetaceae bacterium]|nr:hypothetical protein [Planctomycetaceae bacterium]